MPTKRIALDKQVEHLEAEVARLRREANERARKPRCETCRFYQKSDRRDGIESKWGSCHFNAPQPRMIDFANLAADKGDWRVQFPAMHAENFCGQHDARPWDARPYVSDDPGFSQ